MRLIMLRLKNMAGPYPSCAARCGSVLPYGAASIYCSKRCRHTEQARRRRLRNLLRREGIACPECGAAHYPDGSVALRGR